MLHRCCAATVTTLEHPGRLGWIHTSLLSGTGHPPATVFTALHCTFVYLVRLQPSPATASQPDLPDTRPTTGIIARPLPSCRDKGHTYLAHRTNRSSGCQCLREISGNLPASRQRNFVPSARSHKLAVPAVDPATSQETEGKRCNAKEWIGST